MASIPILKSERRIIDSYGRTLLKLQGAVSLQSLMFDMFSPRKKDYFLFNWWSFEFLHISRLTFPKNYFFFFLQHNVFRKELPGNFKWGVQLVWRRTFLIHTLTAKDSSNDGAFDLAPLDNIPPFQRRGRCLPKDKRMFSSTGEESQYTWSLLIFEGSSRVTQSSAAFTLTFCACFSFFILKELSWNYPQRNTSQWT